MTSRCSGPRPLSVLMYDRLSLRYEPKVGDRVRVVGQIRRYGEVTAEMLIANKIKPLSAPLP